MKLLLASVDALPQVGGISMMMHHLANGLTLLGHDVLCLGPKGAHVPSDLHASYRLIEDWDSRVRDRTGELGLRQDARIRDLFAKIIREQKVERVVLLHPFYYGVGALDAADDADVPISVYFHGFELQSQLRGSYPKQQAKLLRTRKIDTLRERLFYLIGGSGEVLTNSQYTANLFHGFQIKPTVRATGCGIPLDVFERERAITPQYDPTDKMQRRRELRLAKETCIAFLGRLVRTKGVESLLRLCHEEARFSAVILGDGPDRARLEAVAKTLGIGSRVRFLGAVTEDEKWQVLRSADALALLSEPDEEGGQVEGFGIALLEGAAAGCVPISSGTGGMGEVVEHGRTGLLFRGPKDSDALRTTLLPGDIATSLVTSARKQIEDRYNWVSVARTLCAPWLSGVP